MDRGVVIGGVLICASFLLAVALNRSADAPIRPSPAEEPAAVEARCAEDVPRVTPNRSTEFTPRSNDAPSGTAPIDVPCK
jgi:hypothetical protein